MLILNRFMVRDVALIFFGGFFFCSTFANTDLLPISFVYGSERLRTALLLLHKVFCDEEERNNDDEHSVFSEEMKAKLQEVEKSFIACSAAVPSVRPGLLLSVSTLWNTPVLAARRPPPLSVCTEQHNARSFRTGQK